MVWKNGFGLLTAICLVVLLCSVASLGQLCFTDITVSAGTAGPTQKDELGGHGVMFADVDKDGLADFYVTMIFTKPMPDLFFRNLGGTFSFVRSFSAVDGYMAGLADLDNDGDLDIVFAGDDLVYINNGAGNFSQGPPVPVTGINDPRAIAFADIDNDGDLDFAVGVKRSRNWLIRNDCTDGNSWLKVRLISPQGQAGAFGAKVKIYPAGKAPDGTLLGFRQAKSNYGYLGQDDPVLHFGLGWRTSVDVIVFFLDGSVTICRDVIANQIVTIKKTCSKGPDSQWSISRLGKPEFKSKRTKWNVEIQCMIY